MTVLCVVLGICVFAPLYTYAIYPCILRLFKAKNRIMVDAYAPAVSVVIVANDKERVEVKKRNVAESNYGNIKEVLTSNGESDVWQLLQQVSGDVIAVTDTTSTLLPDSITRLVVDFSDKTVGCVSGMSRKAPDGNGVFHDSVNWRYENKIKRLESNLGTLSGGNKAVFAFRKELLPEKIDSRISLEFYVPTAITEQGYDVLFEPEAVAYETEERSEGDLFKKHIEDGAAGYRSIVRFCRLLLPKKGSFVFWSHRVMKWLVPFNMIVLLFGCGILAYGHRWALVLFMLQVIVYSYLILWSLLISLKGREFIGPIGKLSGFGSYFLMLNIAWLIGFFKSLK